ncbi:thiamine-phosphate diphosphorylase [Lentilactobacillus senioris DSM 24302 = JCM 17472]|uniref:Thiamine-phosphate synthase n=1 Tax=Lentilactobacillus senioris DSM 24302 = JCM 17472 TaxID=1423802 RepID=A0A0R2CRU1_9LACO|nr:thiamine phosphate synthase [Lentilactobacillus senioris]KRM94510.1 thiamine-phosphate diphosphorylase [Lentilactobacillus senioris DSM 24302 = JCM 17472]
MSVTFEPGLLRAYFVAGTQDLTGLRDLPSLLDEAIEAGITAFQFREKGPNALTGVAKRELAEILQKRCLKANIPFIIDDDLDLALELNADGIHVGQKDDKIETVVERISVRQMFVGLSANTVEQVEAANQFDRVAYIGSGPIFPTQSKDDADPAIGVAGLTDLVKVSKKPVVAIGGIAENNIDQLRGSGADGAAVISMISKSENVDKSVSIIKEVF